MLAGLLEGSDEADGVLEREFTGLEHGDHFLEVLGSGIAGTEDIEFFLDEETGLVGDGFLGITDVNDAAGEGDLFDGGTEGSGCTDGFDDDIGTIRGEFDEPVVEVLGVGVDGMGGAGFGGEGEFGGVEVGNDRASATKSGCGDCAQAYTTAAKHENSVGSSDAAAVDGMEADAQGFDEAEFAKGEAWGLDEFLPGDGEEFGEGAVALDAEGLIELAGVGAAAAAGGAVAASSVRHDCNGHARGKAFGNTGAGGFDGGGDLVAGDAGELNQGVLSAVAIDVGAAEADHSDPQEDLTELRDGLIDFSDPGATWGINEKGLHRVFDHLLSTIQYSRGMGFDV